MRPDEHRPHREGRNRGDERFWGTADNVCNAGGLLLAGFHELEATKAEYEYSVRVRELDDVRAKANRFRQDNNGLVPTTGVETADVTAALDKPWRVEQPALDTMAAILANTRQLEDQTSSGAILPSVQNLVQIIDVYAAEAQSRIREQALTLASELHCYVGWLLLDGKRQSLAVRHFDTAVSLAVEVDNPDHLAHAASFKGYMALNLGKLGPAVTLSEVSLRDRRIFVALRAFDGYQAGHAYALAGNKRCTERSMLVADRLLDGVPDAPLPAWAYWYNLPFLLTQRAIVHEALGQKAQAIVDLEAGLAEMPLEHRKAAWGRELRERLVALEAG